MKDMYLRLCTYSLSLSFATIDKGDDCIPCQCRVEAVNVDAPIRSNWKEHGATSIYTRIEEHSMHHSTQSAKRLEASPKDDTSFNSSSQSANELIGQYSFHTLTVHG